MMHRFLIVVEKANGNYSAYSPDLPGCVATGKTRDQAARNMYQAIDLHVRGLLEDKLPVPPVPFICRVRRHTCMIDQALDRCPAEVMAHAVRVNRTYERNPKLHAQYADKMALYAEVYPTLAMLNCKLSWGMSANGPKRQFGLWMEPILARTFRSFAASDASTTFSILGVTK